MTLTFQGDYIKPSREVLIDLINHANQTHTPTAPTLYAHDFQYSVPDKLSDTYTEIRLDAASNAPFKGSWLFRYERMRYSAFLEKNQDIRLQTTLESGMLSELMDQVCARWNVRLNKDEDYYDVPFDNNQFYPIVLRARPESLLWVGELSLVITKQPFLSDIIQNRELNGFGECIYPYLSDVIRVRQLDGFHSPSVLSVLTQLNLSGFSDAQ